MENNKIKFEKCLHDSFKSYSVTHTKIWQKEWWWRHVSLLGLKSSFEKDGHPDLHFLASMIR